MNYRVLKTYTQPNVGQIGVGSVSLIEPRTAAAGGWSTMLST